VDSPPEGSEGGNTVVDRAGRRGVATDVGAAGVPGLVDRLTVAVSMTIR
jgi:hypothetical protein